MSNDSVMRAALRVAHALRSQKRLPQPTSFAATVMLLWRVQVLLMCKGYQL
jgi:hypothetical protein